MKLTAPTELLLSEKEKPLPFAALGYIGRYGLVRQRMVEAIALNGYSLANKLLNMLLDQTITECKKLGMTSDELTPEFAEYLKKMYPTLDVDCGKGVM